MPRRATTPPKPPNLAAYTLDVDGEELVLFTWSEAKTPLIRLSPSEREVLVLLARGASNAEIAQARGRSIRTVANQVASLLRKLNVASRFELMSR